ncbi:hypothetical protein VPH35_118500 [Triticum aestivum]
MAGSDDDQKVVVCLRSLGSAPMLRRNKFKISGREKFSKIIEFLRGQLQKDTLFVYVHSAFSLNPFSPKPDELLIDLYNISGRDKFLRVIEFLRRQLHQDTLFVYVNSSFSPSPDELIIDLYNNFAIDGKLVVNYALSAAWG